MNVLYTILAFSIVFGIIVLVHEFGHYIAARLTGVRVEAFSFGFGKRIWGKKIGDTDFRISLVPLGGYVKMAGEEEYDPDNLKPDEFHAKNRGQKIFILVMGPFMNLLLAFLIFTTINITGIKVDDYKYEKPIIGHVLKDSPAEKAGIRKNDLILSIDGRKVKDWQDLEMTIGANANETLLVEYQRNGHYFKTQVDVRSVTRYGMGEVGIDWDFKTELNEIQENYPAAKANLEKNDVLLSINQKPINCFELRDALTAYIGQEVQFEFRRGNQTFTKPMTPVKVYYLKGKPITSVREAEKHLKTTAEKIKPLKAGFDPLSTDYIVVTEILEDRSKAEHYQTLLPDFEIVEKGVLGFTYNPYSPRRMVRLGLWAAMKKGLSDISRLTFMVFNVFRKMIVGKISAGQISGPIEIAKFSGKALESGPTNFFMLIAFISLQLGIINLFPIPALDGGHLLIFSIEAIIRKDFSQRVKMILMNIGFFLLVLLMVFIILNDIAKNLPNGWKSFLPF